MWRRGEGWLGGRGKRGGRFKEDEMRGDREGQRKRDWEVVSGQSYSRWALAFYSPPPDIAHTLRAFSRSGGAVL